MTSGIYYITNKVNVHKYVGGSIDIERRWANHKSQLNVGSHHNPHLQSAWNKYGEENFEFKIIAYTDPDKAIVLEDFILQNYFDRFEYNIAENATAPMLGKEFTDEHKRKIGETKRGEKHHYYGKHLSEETKQKISKSQQGKNNSMYGIHRYGEDSPMYGKHHTEESKKKNSEAHIGEKNSTSKLTKNQVIEIKHLLKETNLLQREIAEIYNISQKTISAIKAGRKWKHIQI